MAHLLRSRLTRIASILVPEAPQITESDHGDHEWLFDDCRHSTHPAREAQDGGDTEAPTEWTRLASSPLVCPSVLPDTWLDLIGTK